MDTTSLDAVFSLALILSGIVGATLIGLAAIFYMDDGRPLSNR